MRDDQKQTVHLIGDRATIEVYSANYQGLTEAVAEINGKLENGRYWTPPFPDKDHDPGDIHGAIEDVNGEWHWITTGSIRSVHLLP